MKYSQLRLFSWIFMLALAVGVIALNGQNQAVAEGGYDIYSDNDRDIWDIEDIGLSQQIFGEGKVTFHGVNDDVVQNVKFPRTLSAYGFFGKLQNGSQAVLSAPENALISYDLYSPLFTDYALKQRFIYITGDEKVDFSANDWGLLDLPVGSAIIKSFGYPSEQGFRPIETRLLLHRADGWLALPYIWRDDMRDADLALAGGNREISVTKPDGTTQDIRYSVPNKNQCKGCHVRGHEVTPIGPIAANLRIANKDKARFDNQLKPLDAQQAQWRDNHFAIWDKPQSGNVNSRARAYLHSNCAHCHNINGPASNSGLFLDFLEIGEKTIGVMKRPVAAGRGSVGLLYDIKPGDAEHSIMPKRMASVDPGVAMPELGRAMVHDEGVALITEWINAMNTDDVKASGAVNETAK